MDIAPLGFSVDTSELQKAQQAATDAAASIGSLGDSVDKLKETTDDASKATKDHNEATKEVASSHKEAGKAVEEHGEAQEKLNKTHEEGSKKTEEASKATKEGKERTEAHTSSIKEQTKAAADWAQSIAFVKKQIDTLESGQGPKAGTVNYQAAQDAILKNIKALGSDPSGKISSFNDPAIPKLKATDAVEAANSIRAFAQETKGATEETKKLGTEVHGTAGIVREMLVLVREFARGNFTNMAGSATILAQKMGLVDKAIKGVKEAFSAGGEGGGIKAGAEALETVAGGAEAAGGGMAALAIVGGGVVAAFAVLAGVTEHFARDLGEVQDEVDATKRRFTDLTGSSDAAKEALERTVKTGNDLGESFDTVREQVADLARSLKLVGGSEEDAEKIQKTITQLGHIGGLSGKEISEAFSEVSRTSRLGVVSTQELNDILSKLPNETLPLLAEALKTTPDGLEELAKKGRLTGAGLAEAFTEISDKVNTEYGQKVPDSIEAANARLGNSFTELKENIAEALNLRGLVTGAEDDLAGLINFINGLGKGGAGGGGVGAMARDTIFALASIPLPGNPLSGIPLPGGPKPVNLKGLPTTLKEGERQDVEKESTLNGGAISQAANNAMDRYGNAGDDNRKAKIKDDISYYTDMRAKAQERLAGATGDDAKKAAADVDKFTRSIKGANDEMSKIGKKGAGGLSAFAELQRAVSEAQAAQSFDATTGGESIYEQAAKATHGKGKKPGEGDVSAAVALIVQQRSIKAQAGMADNAATAQIQDAAGAAYRSDDGGSDMSIDAHMDALQWKLKTFGNQVADNADIVKQYETNLLAAKKASQDLADSKTIRGANDNRAITDQVDDVYGQGGYAQRRAALLGKASQLRSDGRNALADNDVSDFNKTEASNANRSIADLNFAAERARLTGNAASKDPSTSVAERLRQQIEDAQRNAPPEQAGAIATAVTNKDYEERLASVKEDTAEKQKQLVMAQQEQGLLKYNTDEYEIQLAILKEKQLLQEKGIPLDSAEGQAAIKTAEALAKQTKALTDAHTRAAALRDGLMDLSTGLGDSLSSAFDAAFQHGSGAARTFLVGLQNTALQVLDAIIKKLVITPLVNAIGNGLQSLTGGITGALGGGSWSTSTETLQSNVGGGGGTYATMAGGAFNGGTKFMMAGDIVSTPTHFMMAGGATGYMGEAGPEGVLPLRRGSDGRLGVSASGASGDMHVEINDMRSSGQQVQVMQRDTGNGKRKLSVMIRDEVKAGIGDGSFDNANSTQYGSQRVIARR